MKKRIMTKSFVRVTTDIRYRTDGGIVAICVDVLKGHNIRLFFTENSKLYNRIVNIKQTDKAIYLYASHTLQYNDYVQEITGKELDEFQEKYAEYLI